MMGIKKISLGVALFFLLFCNVAISHPVSSGVSLTYLDKSELKPTLADAKKELSKRIDDLQLSLYQIEQQQSLRHILATTGEQSDQSDNRYVEKLHIEDISELKQKLQSIMHQPFTFEQMIIDGDSQIAPNLQDIYRILVKHNANLDLTRIVGTISSRYGKNDKKLPTAQTDDQLDVDGTFTIKKDRKFIAAVDLSLHTAAFSSIKTRLLSAAHREIKPSSNELYRLTDLHDNTLKLFIKKPNNVEYIIEGLAANGRVLKAQSTTEYLFSDAQDPEVIKQNLAVLKDAQQHFSQFNDTQALNNYIAQHKKTPPIANGKASALTISFFGRVNAVRIYVLYDLQPLELKFHLNNRSKHDYCVFLNSRTQKYGLVDKSGNWLLMPQYDALNAKLQKNRFEIGKNEMNEALGFADTDYHDYRFDAKNKQMIPLPFSVVSELTDDLLVVNQGNFDGVYQWSQQRLLIPIQFMTIKRVGNVVVVVKEDKNFSHHRGLYSLQGKEILPAKFDELKIKAGRVYAQLGKQKRVFTLQGNKIDSL